MPTAGTGSARRARPSTLPPREPAAELGLRRNIEERERGEHPLERITAVRHDEAGFEVAG